MLALSAGACSDSDTQSTNPYVATGIAGRSTTATAGSPAAIGGAHAGAAGSATAPRPGMSAMATAGAGTQIGIPLAGAPAAGVGAAGAGPAGAGSSAGAASLNAGSGGASALAGAGAGAAGSAGSAGAPVAGSTATPPGSDITAVCMGGKVGMDSDSSTAGRSSEYAAVKYLATGGNQILSLKTTLLVPPKPTEKQVLFIWPGLQCNNGKDPARLGNGILQPVLTWGPSCSPKKPSDGYASWWMSAMYVNVSTSAAGPTGCAGGDYMTDEVGSLLQIDMSVTGTSWKQSVLDLTTMKSVDYTIDLKGQVQNWATWAIEVPQGETLMPKDEVVFTQSVLTFASPVTSCQPNQRGPKDTYTAPVLSTDGMHCCYDKIVLRKN